MLNFVRLLILMLLFLVQFGCTGFDYSNYFSKFPDIGILEVGQSKVGTLNSFVQMKRLGAKVGFIPFTGDIDFGEHPFQSESTLVFLLRNKGETQVSKIKVEAESDNFVIVNQCDNVILRRLAVGQCAFSITFNPKELGVISENLTVSYDNGKGRVDQVTVKLSGISTPYAFLKLRLDTSQGQVSAKFGKPAEVIVYVDYSGDLLASDPALKAKIPPADLTSYGDYRNSADYLPLSVAVSYPYSTVFTPTAKVFTPDWSNSKTTCKQPISKSCQIVFNFNPDFEGRTDAELEASFSGEIDLTYGDGNQKYALATLGVSAFGAYNTDMTNYLVPTSISVNSGNPVAVHPNNTQNNSIVIPISNGGANLPGVNLRLEKALPRYNPSNPLLYTWAQNDDDIAHPDACILASLPLSSSPVVGIPVTGCRIYLHYYPQAVGSHTLDFKFTYEFYSHGESKKTVTPAVSVTGVGALKANLQAVPTSINFLPSAAYCYGEFEKFALTNSGGVAATTVNFNSSQVGTLFLFESESDPNFGTILTGSTTAQKGITLLRNSISTQSTNALKYTYDDGSIDSPNGRTLIIPFSWQGVEKPSVGFLDYSPPPNQTKSSPPQSPYYLGDFIAGDTARKDFTVTLGICGSLAIPSGLQNPAPQSAPRNGIWFSNDSTCFNPQSARTSLTPCQLNGHLIIPTTAPSGYTYPSGDISFSFTDSAGVSGSISLAFTSNIYPLPQIRFAQGNQSPFSQKSGSYVLNDSSTPAAVGSSKTLNVTLYNDSPRYDVPISQVRLATGSVFSMAGCEGGTIDRNKYCTLSLTLAPNSSTPAGTISDMIQTSYTNLLTSLAVPISAGVSGYVTDLFVPAADSFSVDFGNVFVGNTSQKSVQIKMYGNGIWWGGITSLPKKVTADFSNCQNNSGKGVACDISFTYAPLTKSDSFVSPADIKISYYTSPSDSSLKEIVLKLSGSVEGLQAGMTYSNNNFGKILIPNPGGLSAVQTKFYQQTLLKNSLDKKVVVTNGSTTGSGGASASLTGITMTPSNGFYLNQDASDPKNCTTATVLAPGESCNIRVHFGPTQVGNAQADLKVAYKDQGKDVDDTMTIPLTGIGTVPVQIFAGGLNTCIISEVNAVRCSGANDYGQLQISLPSGAQPKKIAVGFGFICVLYDSASGSGLVSCAGDNSKGQLGSSSGGSIPINGVVDIAAGDSHACALFSNGTATCWGEGSSSQLGTSSALGTLPASGVSEISAGFSHTCIVANGALKCFGGNKYGQLGQGTNKQMMRVDEVSNVNLGVQVTHVSASLGLGYTCAITQFGSVKCFGQAGFQYDSAHTFYGTLGACYARSGSETVAQYCWSDSSFTPDTYVDKYGVVPDDIVLGVPDLAFQKQVIQISLGGLHGCALFTDATLGCWGMNSFGQLGNGTNNNVGERKGDLGSSSYQLSLPAFYSPVSVASGSFHSCALMSDNTVSCWGKSFNKAPSTFYDGTK